MTKNDIDYLGLIFLSSEKGLDPVILLPRCFSAETIWILNNLSITLKKKFSPSTGIRFCDRNAGNEMHYKCS